MRSMHIHSVPHSEGSEGSHVCFKAVLCHVVFLIISSLNLHESWGAKLVSALAQSLVQQHGSHICSMYRFVHRDIGHPAHTVQTHFLEQLMVPLWSRESQGGTGFRYSSDGSSNRCNRGRWSHWPGETRSSAGSGTGCGEKLVSSPVPEPFSEGCATHFPSDLKDRQEVLGNLGITLHLKIITKKKYIHDHWKNT